MTGFMFFNRPYLDIVMNQPNYVEAKKMTILMVTNLMVTKKTNQKIVTVNPATTPQMQTA
jgi:hypothetical protein